MSGQTGTSGSATPARHIRVLHVDDDEPVLDLTADFLETLDDRMVVRSESDPLAVPDLLETEPVDCLVTDRRMPQCDGLELCRRITEEHPDLPVVVFTSDRGKEVADRAMAAGASAYVPKRPGVGQYEELTDRIRDVVPTDRGEGHEESDPVRESQGTV